MRIPCVCALLALAACNSFPATADPRVQVSPYLAIYQLRGNLGLQNDPGTGPQDNRRHELRTFGLGDHEEDVGVAVQIGDGFTGLTFDYYRLDHSTTSTGILDDEFGALQIGDEVSMRATMDELRIGYIGEVWSSEVEYRDRPLEMQVGVGGIVAHRDLALRASTVDGARRQNVDIADSGVVYPAVHFRATWHQVRFDARYAISPDLSFGGDFEGTLQDIEAKFSYTVPYQDITLFAGYRYSVLPVDGTQQGLAYTGDLRIDGFLLGVQVSF